VTPLIESVATTTYVQIIECSNPQQGKPERGIDVTTHKALQEWIDEVAELTQPERIHWCDGSDAEYRELTELLLATGGFIELNQQTHPGCYLHRSDPADVARVEHLTFVCTSQEADAGPNNNWMAPAEARGKMKDLFRGCMKGRTMYVVPYCMGPIDSPLSRCGVEITDSAYVAVNMNIMTRMGDAALRRIEREGASSRACIRSASWIPSGASSCIFPRTSKSRASAPATAAMPCSARNATPCASPAGRPGPRVGSPSTC
jgi:GTP-dependent phosphoenolpyruvate carboxykinase